MAGHWWAVGVEPTGIWLQAQGRSLVHQGPGPSEEETATVGGWAKLSVLLTDSVTIRRGGWVFCGWVTR